MIHMNRWFSSHFFLQSLFMSGGIYVSVINCKWIISCRGCFKCDLWNWKPLIGSGAERNLNGSKITFLLGIVSFWNIALTHLQHWKQEPKIQAQFIVIRLILLHCPTILFYHRGNRFERFLSPYKWTSNLESLNSSCCQKTVSAGTKASPDKMLSYHQWGLVTFTWGQFHWKCSKSLIWDWKWSVRYSSWIYRESMSYYAGHNCFPWWLVRSKFLHDISGVINTSILELTNPVHM